MSQKEIDRAFALDKVANGQATLKQAAEEMHLSYPQAKRLWSRYKKGGRRGLVSKKRGGKSNRAVSQEVCKQIVKIIIENYMDCKPLFISEKLEQHHAMKYSSEFIRQLMTEYHLWFPKKNKEKAHPRRPRRVRRGELLHGDASDHDWFEGRGSRCHLHMFVDDATSRIEGAWFELEETTKGYYKALQPVLEQKGRPVSLYVDKRGTFLINHGNKRGKTQFARAMEELGIKIIIAHSPQAKGRIERAFGTLQERLVWELRIRNICTLEEANAFLPAFIKEYNDKYSKQPSSPFDAYRRLNPNVPLKYILSTKEERTVSKNLEIQYGGEIYQIITPKGFDLNLKKAKVTIITTMEGELMFEYLGHRLEYKLYREQEYIDYSVCIEDLMSQWKSGQHKGTKPSKYHPWKRTQQACPV